MYVEARSGAHSPSPAALSARLAGTLAGQALLDPPQSTGSSFSILFLPQRLPAPERAQRHQPQHLTLLVTLSRNGETGFREPLLQGPGPQDGLRTQRQKEQGLKPRPGLASRLPRLSGSRHPQPLPDVTRSQH